MTRPVRTALLLALVAIPVGGAAAQQPPPAPPPPPPNPPAVVTTNPCPLAKRWHIRCPDIEMKRPFDLYVQRSHGRTLLRAGNSVDNVGSGPLELRGRRTSRIFMHATQRIYRSGRGHITAKTGARLRYTLGHQGLHYWKFYRAARFELWRLDKRGKRRKLVRRGAKIAYCLRDLRRSYPRLERSPRHRVYPACNTNARQRHEVIGTSVGWSDIYPSTYIKQWVNITGLRGCFALRHLADPGNFVFEKNERNNSAQVVLRLPFRRGKQHCPGHSTGEINHETGPY
jgi:hypothetical protein